MCIRFRSLVLIMAMMASFVPITRAQDIPDRIKTIQSSLNNAKAAYDQLPDDVKKNVKPDRRFFQLNDAVNRIAPGTAQGINPSWQPNAGWDQGGADENGLVQVNNPARDRRFSPFFGYTQNSASTARCGDSVVVAFNDSGSILETLLTGTGGVSFTGDVATGTGGLSFSGVASSRDGGETFHDRGAVPPGPDVNTWLMGQPSVACSDRNNFYIAQEARFAGVSHTFPVHGIAFSRSSDGGATWGDPAILVANPLVAGGEFTNNFEDPRIAVDPSNHQRVYVAYAHQFTNTDCAFPGSGVQFFIESKVELLVSNDGGQTFNPTPTVLDDQCEFVTGILDSGVRMAISSDGVVYVAWQATTVQPGNFLAPDSIQVASVAPTGRPSGPVAVDAIFPLHGTLMREPTLVGVQSGGGIFSSSDAWIAQGGFFNEHGFDLAVDRSKGPTNGNVYIAWNDGRNGAFGALELEDDSGFFAYSFTDILFSVSSDGGQTFTSSQQLNSDAQPVKSRGHDHFRPVLAVDPSGKVAACWYDRRNDPQNFQFERFCAESKDGGVSWLEFSIPGSLSTPSVQEDWLIGRADMGQNDDLTTDFGGHVPGFLGGIQWMSSGMNPDIKLVKFH